MLLDQATVANVSRAVREIKESMVGSNLYGLLPKGSFLCEVFRVASFSML